MTRNDPSDFRQRARWVSRNFPAFVDLTLVSVVHGVMNPETRRPASLIIISSRITPSHKSRRVKSATISIRFSSSSQSGIDPVVKAIAPDRCLTKSQERAEDPAATTTPAGGVLPDGFVVSGQMFPLTLEASPSALKMKHITGSRQIVDRSFGEANAARWTVSEDPNEQDGLGIYFQVAMLIERISDENFIATVSVKTDVSGFSLRDLQQDSPVDPVIFDPRLPQMGDLGMEIPEDNLEMLNLYSLVTFKDLLQSRQDVTEVLKIFAESSEQSVIPQKFNSYYYEMRKARGEKDPPVESRELPPVPSLSKLNELFSWMRKEKDYPVRCSSNTIAEMKEAHAPAESQHEPHFDIILQMSDQTGQSSVGYAKALLDTGDPNMLINFFRLPTDCSFVRVNEGGTCQFFKWKNGSTAATCKGLFLQKTFFTATKILLACIIQTPFYETGFWSLILYSETNESDSATRMSGIIQADKDFTFKEYQSEIRKASTIYPMMLPLELYKKHVASTARKFEQIRSTLRDVDDKLLKELEGMNKPEDARRSHRELSKTLHECSMKLVELGRRRVFEGDFAATMMKNQIDQDNIGITQTISILDDISKSREYDMQTLPSKVESQRNILYGLIAQFDNNMQSRLTTEALRDSKAMKTLSIITILFLPGAFVATLFSTNMFSFHGNYEEIWIYFVICVPLTTILMVAWIIWLRKTPYGADEERGIISQTDKNQKLLMKKAD
ncbi:Mg2+ transporter protein CorA-like/Zinc transport protein ZntB [Penicillium herquei]|nr:Mg2+ transporter protein CorA-like/Zinc transport protein ZntB [Penicillium herquei]